MLFRVGFVVAVAACAPIPAAACEATKAAYDRLKLQMTPDEVNEVVGCPGTFIRESEGNGLVIRSFKWADGDGRDLYVSFHNGRLADKTASALR